MRRLVLFGISPVDIKMSCNSAIVVVGSIVDENGFPSIIVPTKTTLSFSLAFLASSKFVNFSIPLKSKVPRH